MLITGFHKSWIYEFSRNLFFFLIKNKRYSGIFELIWYQLKKFTMYKAKQKLFSRNKFVKTCDENLIKRRSNFLYSWLKGTKCFLWCKIDFIYFICSYSYVLNDHFHSAAKHLTGFLLKKIIFFSCIKNASEWHSFYHVSCFISSGVVISGC